MNNPQLAVVYEKAADVVQTNGHCKNWFYDLHSEGKQPRSSLRVCALGALSIAVTEDPQPPEELDGLLAEAVADLSLRIASVTVDENPVERIANWSDSVVRTPAEIVDALLLAAKAAAA
ncbi:hypothetical protein OG285_32705 [Streptomyces sp. NBC_01471]|uniref:DUF6197 family protein n=1 Tax=Streptomyces sp. NBC_01471 TaxID=2903879 RepID=UPI003245D6CC